MSFNIGMQGRFKLVAHKLDGSSRVVADWFNNLILNNGLNGIATTNTMLDVACVGSGTAAPAAGQTQLSTLVSSTSTVQGVSAGNELASGYGWRRITFRFGQGAAQGNLSEVGVGASATNLFSRALILDGTGQPTTVTVLADEFLDVVYEIRVYWPTADATGTATVSGVSTAFTLRACEVGQWGAAWLTSAFGGNNNFTGQCWASGATLGAITGSPSGTFIGQTLSSNRVGSYNNGSFSRTFRLIFDLNGVTQSIGAMRLLSAGNSDMNFQCLFNPAVAKTNQFNLSLDFTLTWSRRSI